MKKLLKMLVFNDQGLIPAIIQDDKTKEVLTLCYMNADALKQSFQMGLVHVFRRSKGLLMMKGKSSGCIQKIKKVCIDCEGKSLLIRVDQVRAACHTGFFTCYYRHVDKKRNVTAKGKRLFDPKKVYKK